MNKNQQKSLTEQNITDIENALLNKIVASLKDENAANLEIHYKGIRDNITIATITWIDGNRTHTKMGVSRKRKGDKYNKRAGRILALIDML